MATVRGLLEQAETEIRTGDMPPARVSELLLLLTGLSSLCTKELTRRELAYNKVHLSHLEGDEPANKATIRAKASQEYEDFCEARDTAKSCTQMIRALNRVMDHQREEMRLTR